MTKPIEIRVQDSFTQREEALKYLDWCRSTLQDFMSSTRRSATSLLVLAALFELVAESRNAKITIGSFSISSGSVVLEVLPILVAFFLFQLIVDTNKADVVMKSYIQAFKLWSRAASANDLDLVAVGPTSLYWSLPALFTGYARNRYRSDAVCYVNSLILMAAISLAVLAFETQAYYILFPASMNALWSISLLCTLYCLIMGGISYIAYALDS
jgi:hypothetical protein